MTVAVFPAPPQRKLSSSSTKAPNSTSSSSSSSSSWRHVIFLGALFFSVCGGGIYALYSHYGSEPIVAMLLAPLFIIAGMVNPHDGKSTSSTTINGSTARQHQQANDRSPAGTTEKRPLVRIATTTAAAAATTTTTTTRLRPKAVLKRTVRKEETPEKAVMVPVATNGFSVEKGNVEVRKLARKLAFEASQQTVVKSNSNENQVDTGKNTTNNLDKTATDNYNEVNLPVERAVARYPSLFSAMEVMSCAQLLGASAAKDRTNLPNTNKSCLSFALLCAARRRARPEDMGMQALERLLLADARAKLEEAGPIAEREWCEWVSQADAAVDTDEATKNRKPPVTAETLEQDLPHLHAITSSMTVRQLEQRANRSEIKAVMATTQSSSLSSSDKNKKKNCVAFAFLVTVARRQLTAEAAVAKGEGAEKCNGTESETVEGIRTRARARLENTVPGRLSKQLLVEGRELAEKSAAAVAKEWRILLSQCQNN